MKHSVILLLVLSLCSLLPVAGSAATALPEGALRDVQALEQQLSNQQWPENMERAWDRLDQARRSARKCVAATDAELAAIHLDEQALGEAVKDEAKDVKAIRLAIKRSQREEEGIRTRCKSLELTATRLLEQVEQERDRLRHAALGARSTPVYAVLIGETAFDFSWAALLAQFQPQLYGWGEQPLHRLLPMLLIGGLMLGAGLGLRKPLCRFAQRQSTQTGFNDRLITSFLVGTAYYAPHMLILLGWSAYWAFAGWRYDVPFTMLWICLVFTGYVLFRWAVEVLLLPRAPSAHYLALDEHGARRFGRQLNRAGWVPVLLGLVWLVPLSEPLPDTQTAVFRLVALSLLVVVLGGLANRVPQRPEQSAGWRVRIIVWLVLCAIWVLEFLGYRGLSEYVLLGSLGTLLLAGAAWFMVSLWADALDSMDEGRYGWQKKLRHSLELGDEQGVPGLVWLRIVGSLSIWFGAGWLLLAAWGATPAQRAQIVGYVTEGFHAGTMEIVPLRVIMAMVLFAVIAALVGWFRRQLDQRWLGRARMDPGAKNALVTMSGYIGIAVGLLVALGLAGVDFSSLAIIAGALSVGIGFGLQNVVNNFVSGLILLFERPIRNGDWIVVGSTEGYVQKISIRSTIVRTFDRSEVIVPNSELISNQVTNWMLMDRRGRVKAPIGVAYGSDVEKVKQILLGIAESHPERARDRGLAAPQALFLGFGDSSLNFEMRFFIRDVDKRMQVLSEVNFAIDKAFREAGIEIPFPQRVVHMVDSDADGTCGETG